MKATQNNHLSIVGTISKIDEVITDQTGNFNWKKQSFVLSSLDDAHPNQILISVWGDNLIWLERCQVNDVVECKINIRSKNVNGKWFTEITAWRIDIDIRLTNELKADNHENN
jgi:hypothetical protein